MPLNDQAKRIITGNRCQVLADCTVDLISRRQRPYLFKVTVCGKPPHNVTRVYEIAARHEDGAAMRGLEIFKAQMSTPLMRFLLGGDP